MLLRRALQFLALLLTALAAAAPAAAKDFKSARISISVEGKGQDVILIPGHSSSPRVWSEMIAAIPGYRYHKVQIKGFAGTDKDGNSEGDVAAPAAEEIARYIGLRKMKSVTVIGHSMGGTIGMMLAARHPPMVSKLMVVDMLPFMGSMFGGPKATAESLRPVAEQIKTSILNSPADAYAGQLATAVAGMIATESKRAGALEDAQRTDRDVAARAFGELVVTDLRPELFNISATSVILYVTPTGAPLTDAQMDGFYRASYANLADVKLTRISNAAHFIMWDNPSAFHAQVRALLTQ